MIGAQFILGHAVEGGLRLIITNSVTTEIHVAKMSEEEENALDGRFILAA